MSGCVKPHASRLPCVTKCDRLLNPMGGAAGALVRPIPDVRSCEARRVDPAAEGRGEMKLAEALALRTDVQRRIEQLRARIVANARYQEGEPPAEDAGALLVEVEQTLVELRELIARINATNSSIRLDGERTMTDALAERDVLRLRHSVLTDAAEAASGHLGFRQMRSELRQLSALPVADLRARADDAARQLRELDGRIQQANWEHDVR